VDILLSIAAGAAQQAVPALAEEGGAGLQINLFWIIVSSLNFLLFLFLISRFAFGPINQILESRRTRIEQGLKDAEQARRDRENAEKERAAALQEARREANEILARAQKIAQETRDADIAATKADLERIRERAAAEIEAEKQRAITELRTEVADLALQAASKVVGETLNTERERRLVAEFLTEINSGPNGSTRG
jgi:F-type H+-transporting ATPase subunit b